MIPPIDIFQTEGDGSVLWLEAASTLDEAKMRVQELGERAPGTYIILSHKTGSKLVMKVGDMDGEQGTAAPSTRRSA